MQGERKCNPAGSNEKSKAGLISLQVIFYTVKLKCEFHISRVLISHNYISHNGCEFHMMPLFVKSTHPVCVYTIIIAETELLYIPVLFTGAIIHVMYVSIMNINVNKSVNLT